MLRRIKLDAILVARREGVLPLALADVDPNANAEAPLRADAEPAMLCGASTDGLGVADVAAMGVVAAG